MTDSGVTLRTIAERANVSVAAVSYVLNGKGRMSPEKRRDIHQLLREAGYQPKYKRHPIFYLMDHVGLFRDMHSFEPFLRTYDGLNGVFRNEEMTLRIEFLGHGKPSNAREELEQLATMNPGGLILDTSLSKDMEEICKFCLEHNIPAVQVGHVAHSPLSDAVVIDSFGGAYDATKYLINQGHRRIATIRWNVQADPASNKKFAGFTCAMAEAGIPVRPEYVVESPFTKRDGQTPGRVAMRALLETAKPPTAVFIENSFISPSLIYTEDCTEQELPKALQDIEMVHFEAWNLEWIEQAMADKLNYPARHTKLMRINWEELGRVAGRLLMAQVEHPKANGGHTEVIGLAPRLYEVHGHELKALGTGAQGSISK